MVKYLVGSKLLLCKARWRHGVVVIITAQLHSTTPELRFCSGSNPARGVSGILDGEDFWQWSQLELNAYRRWTIPQKQFIILLHNFCLHTSLLTPEGPTISWNLQQIRSVIKDDNWSQSWLLFESDAILVLVNDITLFQVANF